jgi:mannose/fructose/N-acetylgalactosamine-specific phosphotransferase system component IID
MAITKGKIISTFVLVILAVILILAAYTWITLSWSYSKGERAGYIQKFSQKGWVCKTWEGELTMVVLAGAIPEKFQFTVRNDDVAARINSTLGKKVKIYYAQHKGVPTSCLGETEYFVTGIQTLE